MGFESGIEWTDHTFNGWIGCSKVSEGCKFCYAEQLMDHRFGRVKWGPTGDRVRTSPSMWRKPRVWDKQAWSRYGRKARVFTASLADIFEPREDLIPWRADLFKLIEETPNLIWQVLTKHPDRVLENIPAEWYHRWPRNCWLGTSVENQPRGEERINYLSQIRRNTNVPILFLSCEPLIGPIKSDNLMFEECLTCNGSGWVPFGGGGKACPDCIDHQGMQRIVDWVIVGGESGQNARPMNPHWVDRIQKDCLYSDTPFFFKQWGKYVDATEPAEGGEAVSVQFDDEVIETEMLEFKIKSEYHKFKGKRYHEFPDMEFTMENAHE